MHPMNRRGATHLLSEKVTMIASMSSTVRSGDSSNVRARVVMRSSVSPMTSSGWMELLRRALMETTGFEVETVMFTNAVELGDVLMESESAGWAQGRMS